MPGGWRRVFSQATRRSSQDQRRLGRPRAGRSNLGRVSTRDIPMNVIIMASGEQVRFGPNQPLKQMLEVWGQTLIERMVNQCRARGIPFRSIYLITHHEELLELAINWVDLGLLRSERLAESILNTRLFWDREDRTGILLCDVFYTDLLMSEILAEHGPIRFYGNHLEMFAVSLSPSQIPEFQEACRTGSEYVTASSPKVS